MIIGRLDFTLRWPTPIRIRVVRDYWCPRCDRYSPLNRGARCPTCFRPLRRILP